MEITDKNPDTGESRKVSLSDEAALMLVELDKHGVTVPWREGEEAVRKCHAEWREKREQARTELAERAEAERRQRAEELRLEGMRQSLRNAGIEPFGMDAGAMQEKLAELQQQWEARRLEAEAEQRRQRQRKLAETRFNASGCPARHVANMESPLDTNERWLATLDQLTEKLNGGFLVGLLGRRGTGKTQLAVALIRRACNAGHACRYIKAMDLFREIRGAYTPVARGQAGESEGDVIERLASVGVLVIDECHQRGDTPFENNTLTNLLDRRYDAMLATVLISNQEKGEFAASMGDSVVSRIYECGAAIWCDWESYRKPGQWQ